MCSFMSVPWFASTKRFSMKTGYDRLEKRDKTVVNLKPGKSFLLTEIDRERERGGGGGERNEETEIKQKKNHQPFTMFQAKELLRILMPTCTAKHSSFIQRLVAALTPHSQTSQEVTAVL